METKWKECDLLKSLSNRKIVIEWLQTYDKDQNEDGNIGDCKILIMYTLERSVSGYTKDNGSCWKALSDSICLTEWIERTHLNLPHCPILQQSEIRIENDAAPSKIAG